nr:MAG TPA: hypothetical protein [Caudoviricetes sp.]
MRTDELLSTNRHTFVLHTFDCNNGLCNTGASTAHTIFKFEKWCGWDDCTQIP